MLMAILDKIMAAFKPAQKAPDAPAPEAPAVAPDAPVDAPNDVAAPDPAALADMASQLEAFVYDPELASELAPAFVAMSAVEGFDKVMELFAAKEKQIEALNVGGQEQKSTPEVQEKPVEDDQPKPKSATDILRERAKAQNK